MSNPADSLWDTFVENHGCGDLVQTTAWAASKRAIGQQCELAVVRSGGRVLGGAMLVTKRIAAEISVGYCARGPLAEGSCADAVDATVELARSRGVGLLLLQAAPGDAAMDEALAARGFETGCPSVAPEATIRLDLTKSDEELLAAMSEMRRRNIRKALRSELEVIEDGDVGTFQRLHASTAERQGFVAISQAAMQAQWDLLAPLGQARIFLAWHRGVPVAGIFLTNFARVVTFKFAGWDASSEGSRNANEALHWQAMQWARNTGAERYDLGGFDRKAAEILQAGGKLDDSFSKTPGFFKLGFGGRPMLLPQARWQYLGPAAALIRPVLRGALASKRLQRLAGRLRNG